MNERTFLVPLTDGGIIEIDYDSTSSEGCDTCDYGSSYVDEFSITMSSGKIKIEVDNMYKYALSEGYMMELLSVNLEAIKLMSEDTFFEWLKDKIENHNKGDVEEPITTVEFLKLKQDNGTTETA